MKKSSSLVSSRAWITVLLTLLAMTIAIPCWGQSLVATTDRQQMTEGETLQLTLTVDGRNVDGDPNFAALQKDFNVIATSKMSQLSIVNGKSAALTQWIIVLSPKHAGKLQIPAVTFGKLQSQPLTVDVRTTKATAAALENGKVFLEVSAEPRQPYVQSNVLYTARLFFMQDLQDASLTDPTASNAMITRIGKDARYFTVRNGRHYAVAERRYTILPQASGTVVINSPVFTALTMAEQRYSANFDMFFTRPSQRMRITAANITLHVQAKPSAISTANWLPAQQLTLRELNPLPVTLRVGEPMTRTITIDAQGLSGEQLPKLVPHQLANANVYPEQSSVKTNNDHMGVNGQRIEKWVFIPTQPGTLTLPALTVHWWNTRTNHAETAVLKARALTVLPAANNQETSAISKEIKRDVAQPTPVMATHQKWYATRTWFWVSVLFFLVWVLTLAAWWWQKYRGSSSTHSLHAARRALRAACYTHDPQLVKAALLAWAAWVWPQQPVRTLSDIAERINVAELTAALAELDALLYAEQKKNWNGIVFWQLLQTVSKRATAKKNQQTEILPALYPEKDAKK